jgi:D-glycero-D-manno-heptose 1,7-bisphosphate phosphatase
VRPAVFLDRDGTLIREVDYLSDLSDLAILPGIPEALRRLGQAGYLLLVVTNQSGVARGYFDLSFVEGVHAELARRLETQGARLDRFYVCPHHPEFGGPCACRKPAPGLILQAAADWDVDLARSWVVGDKACDLELARSAGCHAALVRTGYGVRTEEELKARGAFSCVVADDLAGVAEEILKP